MWTINLDISENKLKMKFIQEVKDMECKSYRDTNDRKFIEEVCSKCINKHNNEDLCNIIIRMDGKPDCCNKKLKED